MANGQQQKDKQKKGWKKKGTRHPNLHPHGQETDVGAVFNQPQNGMAEVMKDFTKQGLRTNWGQRKVPVEKISDLEWIQANGPLGNVHPDGRKATRPEIVAARENDLNRRNQVDMSKVGQAVQERKNLQKMQEPENNPSPFKVAFGLDGQPVGFSTPKGSSFGKPLPSIDETTRRRLNRTGEFTSGERSAIRKKIQEAPAESMRLLDEEVRKMRNMPVSKEQQMSYFPGLPAGTTEQLQAQAGAEIGPPKAAMKPINPKIQPGYLDPLFNGTIPKKVEQGAQYLFGPNAPSMDELGQTYSDYWDRFKAYANKFLPANT